MMTTTATTIFDATTGTLSPKVQSLVSSRVRLGKVFKHLLRHTGGCAKRYYVNAAHTSPVGYQRLRACPNQQPFKGSSVHTHSTKISDSSSTSCSFPSCFVENAMLVFFFEARRLVARLWDVDSAPTKQVEIWHDPRRAVLATNARYLDHSRVVLGTI